MDLSVQPTEWKVKASAGKHWQSLPSEAPQLGPESPLAVIEIAVLMRVTFSGALNEASKHSGKEDWQIADEIHISHGYMSRFMRGVGQQWARRLVAFMRATRSIAPLQWIAHQVGCDLVIRSSREARIRELESALLEAKGLA